MRDVSADSDHEAAEFVGARRKQVEALFRREYAPLVRLACFLVDDRWVAEEIVQDAFVGLFARWEHLDNGAAAPGYLRATVVNRSRSRLRRLAVHRRLVIPRPDQHSSAETDVLEHWA